MEDVEAQQEEEARQKLSEEERMSNWKNPSSRIIRVSRASGGKDRHSKVLTSKGLRDRRIRLSVATAIQFYDLQDRLGFDQPSKAVEWLIKAAADSISDLPSINTNFDQEHHAKSESSLLSLGERRSKDLQNAQSSFTQLLTRGFDQPGSGQTNCFNPVQLPQLSNNPFSLVPDYSFGISSSNSPAPAITRGTLQSNSQSLFLSNNINQRSSSTMDGQSISAGFDRRLYLYYGEGYRSSENKGKGR